MAASVPAPTGLPVPRATAVGITPGPNGQAVPASELRRLEVWGTRSLIRFAADLWLGVHVGNPDRGRRD